MIGLANQTVAFSAARIAKKLRLQGGRGKQRFLL